MTEADKADARKARLAQALRENLRRRKAAARSAEHQRLPEVSSKPDQDT